MAGHFLRLLILIYCQICLNAAARGITFSLNSVTSQVVPFGPITPIIDKPIELQDTTILDRNIVVGDASNIKNLDVSALRIHNENDKYLKDPINFRPYIDPSKVRPDLNGNWPPHNINTLYDPNFQNNDLFKPYGNTIYPIFTPPSVSSISPEFNVRLPVTNEPDISLIPPTSLDLKTSNNINTSLGTTLDPTMTLPTSVTSTTTPLKLKPSISNFEPCSLVKVPPASMATVTINPYNKSQISQIFYNYNYLIPSPNMLPKPKIPFYTQNLHEINAPPNTFMPSTFPYWSVFHNMYTASLARSELTPNYLNYYQQVPKIEIPLSLRESCYEFNKKLVENCISVQLSKGKDHSLVSYDQSCFLSSPALLNYYASSPNSLSSDIPPLPNTSPEFTIYFPVKSFPADDISVQPIIPNRFSRTLDTDTSCSENLIVMQELPLNTLFDVPLSPLCVDSTITEDHSMRLLGPIPSSNEPKFGSTPIVYENTVLSAMEFGDFSIDSASPTSDPKTCKRSSYINLNPGISSVETNPLSIVDKKDCNEVLLSDHSISSCKKAVEKLLEILALVESLENFDQYEWDTLHTIISLSSVL